MPKSPARPTTAPPALVWFGRDLRLADNPALHAAAAGGRAVLPVYVREPDLGGAARWWLHHSLTSLADGLAALGARLVLRQGDPAALIPALAREVGAAEVHVGEPPEPAARAAMDQVASALATQGTVLHRHRSELLFAPEQIRTKSGGPFVVFTPFARACLAAGVPGDPLPAPRHLTTPQPPRSDDLAGWELLPTRPDWAGGLREAWTPGEAGANARLTAFMAHTVEGYDRTRNLPGEDGSSRLSPHLHWGEISVRQVWHASLAADAGGPGGRTYRSELLWREFCAHLLRTHPTLRTAPLRAEFGAMKWRDDAGALAAWQRGRTGIPLVDAGMRQLWQTGWLHNRVRLVVGSFLIKHLLIDWREGEAWFWDTLVDADLASNAANWQWVAGCGADASPFFRIFNPVLQGKKFDADAVYIRRFVPELARLPNRLIHAPWEAPPEELAAAGVTLGRDYPRPIVDLSAGRDRALAAFRALDRNAA